MASPSHVHDETLQVTSGHSVYAPEPEFTALFSDAVDQPFDQNWNIDTSHLSMPRSHSTSLPQTWQTSTSIQRPVVSALGAAFDPSSQYYGRTFSHSPSPYQEAAFSSHGNMNPYHQQAAVDPSLVSTSATRHSNFDMGMRTYSTSTPQTNTIAPQALQSSQSLPPNGPTAAPGFQDTEKGAGQSYAYSQGGPLAGLSPTIVNQSQPVVTPKGEISGKFIIKDFDSLCKATKSNRLHNFVNIGDFAQDLPITKTTIPQYVPRKSRNELKTLAAGDKKLLERIAKKPSKKSKSASSKAARAKTESGSAQSPSDVKQELSDTISETDSSDDNSDYSSSDDETPEPSPLPASRPEEPHQAVRYDIIKSVWMSRKSAAKSEQIRSALGDFWEVVRTIRDRWRTDNNAVKQAEEAKKLSELPLLKGRVKSQREMMEVALKTALDYGHPDIIRLFGENKPFLFLLYQFLADRVRDQEYNGNLSNAVLEILARCSTLTNEVLEETKVSKVLYLFNKRGDDRTKAKTKQILDSAAAASKTKADSPAQDKPDDSKDVKPKTDSSNRSAPEPVAGIKRPRPSDGAIGEPVKRVSSKPGATAGTKPPGLAQKRTVPEKPSASSTAAAKAKVVAKPSTFFSSIQSASKKVAPSNAAKSASQPKAASSASTEKKPAPAAPMAPTKPAFSFAETMANLMKPKEPEPVAKPAEKRPPETPEERAKRLRKEERRKLRVTFRPDASLVSIRYFTHDPEEELGHDASMVRDAGDVGGEGRMFKQHKDMMELDDEDDDLPREESYRNWLEPSPIDFSVINPEERKKNFDPYGGGVNKPACPEKEANERREANTLMVFYSHPSDIPPSPREPPETPEEESPKMVEFGAPPADILARAAAFEPVQVQPPPMQDLTALLSVFQQHTPQQQQPAAPAAPASDLEKIFANFSAPTQQPAPQPQIIPPAQQQYAAPVPDLSSIISALQQQQVQAPQQPQYPASFPSAIPPAQGVPTTDLSAIISVLSQTSQQGSMPQMPGFGFPNLNQQGQAQQQQAAPYENEERKRFREGGGYEDRDHGSYKKHKNKGGNNNNSGTGFKPHKLYPCRFFKEGKCVKGDACTYIHDRSDRR